MPFSLFQMKLKFSIYLIELFPTQESDADLEMGRGKKRRHRKMKGGQVRTT